MRARWLTGICGLVAATVAGGCGGAVAETTGSPPASAAIAPADAIAYVTVVTDDESAQWQRADSLLSLFPGARAALLEEVADELEADGLTWSDDIEPALGSEVVVVVTADRRPVLLLQPEDQAKLDALLARSDERVVRGTVSGWTALAERRSDLDAYRVSLGRGSLESNSEFVEALTGLPSDALVRAWVDLGGLADELGSLLEDSGTELDLGLDSLSAAISAEDDGALMSIGVRAPGGSFGSSYEPELFADVPADAVFAVSFGGSQGAIDRLAGSIDLDAVSAELEDAVGVSLDGVLDALSGEGVVYVRKGASVPEITVVLAPPDPAQARQTVARLVQTLAEESGGELRVVMEDGIEVTRLAIEGTTVSYASFDDRVIVTTGADPISSFGGDGSKLADSDAYRRAADAVELGDRTSGFVYLDFDGLVGLVDEAAGPDVLPGDVRDALGTIDSLILQTSAEGGTTRVRGFLRVER